MHHHTHTPHSLLPKDEAEHALGEATLAAKRAGDYLRSQFGHARVAGRKAEHDELLDVDLRAEELILTHLRAAFPTHSILSEEAGEIVGDSDRCWVVDALDASFNFQQAVRSLASRSACCGEAVRPSRPSTCPTPTSCLPRCTAWGRV